MGSKAPPTTRPDPRCRECGYRLDGLGDSGVCPECGRGFDLARPSTYLFGPPFLAWRFWLPALVMGLGCGLIVMVSLVFIVGNWGWALWFGTPISVGCVIGYRFRSRVPVLVLLSLIAAMGFAFAVVGVGLGGALCGLILGSIAFGPILLGFALGIGVRQTLKLSGFSQRSYLPILLFAGFPMVWAIIEGGPARHAPERVSSSLVVDSTPERLWDSIVFYEELGHAPPLLVRWGTARPLRSSGSITRPGDEKRCVWSTGRLTKRATVVEPGRRLEFVVVEQSIGYERDLRLIGGSFELTPMGPDRTRVTLTTVYEPRLTPRFAWGTFERGVVHTLHGHVLEGMRLNAEDAGRGPWERPEPEAATERGGAG